MLELRGEVIYVPRFSGSPLFYDVEISRGIRERSIRFSQLMETLFWFMNSMYIFMV